MERAAHRLAQRDGQVVQRLVTPGRGDLFPLTYVRTGPRSEVPVLVLPGGPGLASVAPYGRFRTAAARRGMDVLMVEHRGVGLSRRDAHDRDLPRDAVTVEQAVDDLAAVLDHVGARRAVVYGSSYGTYLAQGLGVRHPDRVEAMVLDSPMLSVEGDLALVRAHRRRLLWTGEDPALVQVAESVRAVAAAGVPMDELSSVVQVVFEFAGPEVLHRLLLARRRGRLSRTWQGIARLVSSELNSAGVPFMMEPDLVAGITYGQLGSGLPPDGQPLDPQLVSVAAAAGQPGFAGEPFDLPTELPRFTWPIVVVSGDRDLRTPRPVARQLVGLAPRGTLVPLAGTGHSALDTHQLAALHIAHAAAAGAADGLPSSARRLAALPRRGPSRLVGTALRTIITAMTSPP